MPPQPRDGHFSEWFPTADIFANLTHRINELVITIEEVIPFSPPTPPPFSLTDASSLIEFFSPAPSTLSGKIVTSQK